MTPASRTLWGMMLALLYVGLSLETRADEARAAIGRPAAASAPTPHNNHLAEERDKLWRAATEAARKPDWPLATRFGTAALQFHERHFADQQLEACRMLEQLTVWYVKQRQFPAALTASRRAFARRRGLLGEQHWQTVDARLDTSLVERLTDLNEDEFRQFLMADALHAEAISLGEKRRISDGLAKAEAAHPLYLRLLGRDNPLTLGCVMTIVTFQLELGNYFAALPHVQELSERQAKVHGLLHPQTIRTQKLLGRFNESIGIWSYAEDYSRNVANILKIIAGENHAATVEARVELAKMLVEQGKLVAAEPILVAALKQQREQLGGEHLATAQTLKVLGGLYVRAGKLAEAEPILNESVALCRTLVGNESPATAGALNARGCLRLQSRRFQLALDDFNESLAICKRALGEQHPQIVKVLDNQARLYEACANTGLARTLRSQCLQICERAFGETNLQTATALENLSRTLMGIHDYGLAEAYLLRARETRRKLLGETHPQTAIVVAQLGLAYLGVGTPDRARPLIEESLRTLDKASGEFALDAARVRLSLASLLRSDDQFAAAEIELRRALQAVEKLARNEYFLISAIKVNLSQTLFRRGNLSEARRLVDEVLANYGQFLHPDDVRWIDALMVSATVHLAAGEMREAERKSRRCLEVARGRMLMSGAFESERQRIAQFQVLRDVLDLYLSLPIDPSAAGSTDVNIVYPQVLTWKGGAAAKQWRDRQFSTAEAANLTAELQQISRRLASLTLRIPDAEGYDNWIRRIFELNMRKEVVEQQRAAVCTLRADVRDEVVTPAQLRQVLPPGVVLIDILQYPQITIERAAGGLKIAAQQRYTAFIVRRDKEVQRLDLGEVSPISEAVLKWRKTRGFRPNRGKPDWAATAGSLLWPLLKPHVAGCQTVLISPDGRLSQLAWNVLPGARPDSYLIEDYAIGMVPVPQLLPAILSEKRQSTKSGERLRDSLLLVGDVNYDAVPSSEVKPAGSAAKSGGLHFTHLPGTAAEVQFLRAQFQRSFPRGEAVLLDKGGATESAFWREAPRHRWIHVATHGFFSPAAIRSALVEQNRKNPASRQTVATGHAPSTEPVSLFHAGFLNGLALGGANVGATGEEDDGILTATELSTMDLRNVEVAVLSGCETGLGEVQGGEGSFGLQRALEIAGVGATVGSLWTVSDEKTNMLMQQFYANLWDKKLSRLEALREAQLWMLRSGEPGKRVSPHYWAAFTLCGDWR